MGLGFTTRIRTVGSRNVGANGLDACLVGRPAFRLDEGLGSNGKSGRLPDFLLGLRVYGLGQRVKESKTQPTTPTEPNAF